MQFFAPAGYPLLDRWPEPPSSTIFTDTVARASFVAANNSKRTCKPSLTHTWPASQTNKHAGGAVDGQMRDRQTFEWVDGRAGERTQVEKEYVQSCNTTFNAHLHTFSFIFALHLSFINALRCSLKNQKALFNESYCIQSISSSHFIHFNHIHPGFPTFWNISPVSVLYVLQRIDTLKATCSEGYQ